MHFLFRLDLSLHADAGKKIWNLESKHGPGLSGCSAIADANAATSGTGSQVARIPSNPFNQINQCRREARKQGSPGREPMRHVAVPMPCVSL